MALVVRSYTEADRDGFAHVRSKVYRGGVPLEPHEAVMRPDTFGTVAELNGRIIGVETDIDMTCTVRGESVRCMGVAGVGVLPEARRGGIGLEMLTKALPLYKERGAAMASLMPFRARYYRKAGYATCGSRLSLKVPTNRLPYFDTVLDVWELPPNDYSSIVPCYEAFAKRYSGMNLRADGQWNWQLGGDNRFALYAAGNPPEAYISTRLKWDFWVEQEVRDFAWTTLRGYQAMIGLMRGLCINKTAVKWWAPADDPMLWRYDDQSNEAKYDGFMMYRILDVARVLSAGTAEDDGEFRFGLEDSHLEENGGVWSVRASEGRKTVERSGGEPDFELDIQALTQAALGEPSLDALARMGLVRVNRTEGFEAALRILRPHPTFCLDFF